MNENPKSIKRRRVIKHKLRTLIANLQLELNKVKKNKTPLDQISSYFLYQYTDFLTETFQRRK